MNTKGIVPNNQASSDSLNRLIGSTGEYPSFPSLYREMSNWMQDWDNLLGDVFGPRWNWPSRVGATVTPWSQTSNVASFNPAIDIRENNNEYTITAELPGIDPNDVEISLQEGTLLLKGEKKFEQESSDNGYHRVERSYGSFRRAIRLPDRVDQEHIEANYQNGLLTLTVPKLPELKPEARKIAIKTQSSQAEQPQAQLGKAPEHEQTAPEATSAASKH